MIIPGILFLLGLLCLIKGGDWFVDGASALARRFHLPELLIGATVVSIGTTLPEVMVSTISAVSGHGEIAYGNAIGSVICNAALIAAITVAVRPGKVDPKTLRVPVAFFFAAAAIYCVAAYGMGRFTRPMGLLMLGMFVAYMAANVWQMKNAPAEPEHEEEPMGIGKIVLLLVVGAALIALGANLLVDNGTIIAQALSYGIAFATVEEIEAHNILGATFLAMNRAIAQLSPQPALALIDGNRNTGITVPSRCIVGGDGKCADIAAASVLAKVTRDRYMRRMAETYPQYGFEKHKGYGTAAHYAAIRAYGPSPIHRPSFLKKMH